MKNKRRFGLQIIAALLLVLLFGVPVGATPVSEHGALSVKGSHLVDAKGKNFQLKGVSTHGIAWFPGYVNKNAFKSLRDNWGANTVRLAMYTEEYGGYCSNGNKSALKKKVQEGVQAATDLGMYVIIDWHVLSDQNPNKHKKEAIAFFKEMAKKYKNQKNVIYEICNEPNNCSWQDIKDYADVIIPIIRENDPDSVIIVGTPDWSSNLSAAIKEPLEYDNLLYSFHFYAASHKDDYRNRIKEAIDNKIPVFISEFGVTSSNGGYPVDYDEANIWTAFLEENNISYVMWNFSTTTEPCAAIKNGTLKKSAFSAEEYTETGHWLMDTIAKYSNKQD